LDAYLLLRFTWLCLRICLFGTFFGMVVLAPLYYTQTGGIAKGFYQLVSV
jgi:Late exocytosis, associated with Golgi transport